MESKNETSSVTLIFPKYVPPVYRTNDKNVGKILNVISLTETREVKIKSVYGKGKRQAYYTEIAKSIYPETIGERENLSRLSCVDANGDLRPYVKVLAR